MSGAPDSTLADPQQIITDLQRQLAECRAERDGALAERDNAQRRLAERTAERDEAWEQQTASAEVLQVINSSPGDLTPVFDALLEKAMQLCEATFGGLTSFDGERFHTLALRGLPTEAVEAFREPWVAGPGAYHENLVRGEPLVHTDFGVADPARRAHPQSRAIMEMGKARTGLIIALCKDERLLGSLFSYRQEIRPFSDKQIALLQNFAAQAVIAMENARLITETREALEQQTATAEVLQVINSSPGDLEPVFQAMLDKAMRLCEAAFGVLWTYDGERIHAAALRGVTPAFAEFLTHAPHPVGRKNAHGRLLAGESVVHIADVAEDEAYRSGDPVRHTLVEVGGGRTLLAVPLRKDDRFLGDFVIYRTQVQPFSDKQIALLQNFAAQAVIAMENARLLVELRTRTGDLEEALEYQTAISDVLKVISQSGSELGAVLDTLVGTAARICRAESGFIFRLDDGFHRMIASFGIPPEYKDFQLRNPIEPGRGTLAGRTAIERRAVHIEDAATDPEYTRVQAVGLGRQRTMLGAPLVRDDALVGVITLARTRVEPFTQQQIELVTTFADQAVIAIENTRLLTELRESLEQQTATAEVLQVINSSPGDLAPVFDAILEKAQSLCDSGHGTLFLRDGDYFRPAAMRGVPEAIAERLRSGVVGPDVPVSRPLLADEPFVHITDTAQSDHPMMRLARETGVRTLLSVPLRKGSEVLGMIVAARFEAPPFSDRQIALLQNFAAQAVIAIENARLITETREALEQQTATAEVLQVINSSPGDLAPVFDAILEKAHSLCGADRGALVGYDGKAFRAVATCGMSQPFEELMRRGFAPVSGSPTDQLLRGETVHILDLPAAAAESPPEIARLQRRAAELVGTRTLLMVPLCKDGELLGYIAAYRQEVRPFTDKQIGLLQNFAAQAVIAMENARLLTETREALEQQTATAEVLQVINSSPGDLAPVFDAMLERAMRLCEAAFGMFWTYDGVRFEAAALRGVPAAFAEFLREPLRAFHRETGLGRMLRGERVTIHVDMAAEEAYRAGDPLRRAIVDLGGAHSAATVALRKDDTLLGAFTVFRQEVRPFTDKQIALLENFAAQAVIAMENARLLDEIRQRQQELRVTFDNMVDGVAMFDEELHLAAWNRNFQELLQLPDELLAKRHDFDSYTRYLVERGEFGETDPETQIARLRARIGDHYSFERTRPDGTVIEVRHNPMPGGGIVLIYSDITERKRSEAEIKAARDAAEAAYHDLKAAQASLIQAEKMASLGQLTAGIAHEIKNPLNFVNNFAGLSVELLDELKETADPAISALDDQKRAEIDETISMLSGNLEKIVEHGRRADNIVTSMLEHSRVSSGERRSADLNALVEEALNLAYHGGRAQDQSFNITLERDYADMIALIELVPQDITRVCLNLFGNGFYAATKRQREASDPSFKPTLKVSTRDLGEAVEIRVRDNGIGIPPEIKDKLFQPFFTTKPAGEGTGLGLSISYDIVTQQHGGTITVESRVGEFTEFTVRLPRAYRTTTAEAAS